MLSRWPYLLLAALATASVHTSRSAAQPAPAPATLTIHADGPGPKVNPSLYGVFFEEINHAGDGGLYAELVRNRSFEDRERPEAWSAVERGGKAALGLDGDRPLNSAQAKSLRVELSGSGEAGAANEGYWGIPVRGGGKYRLTFFARGTVSGPLTASLEGSDGRVYGRRRFDALSAEWRRFSGTLEASSSDPRARLVLTAPAPGTVWLDVVSLFPANTWKRRPNGMRKDLAELVRELRPGFVRFPGGCFCEGDRLANAFRWKKTIGPIEERPGHWNLWNYRSTDGLGYHEYLQWCEDLNAEPMFVINCGMAHEDHVPLDQLDEWVQDALDAVEYANGPVTTKWGALRAQNGHPKPFNLKYLEIGNENGWGNTLPAYEARYARFYDALKKRYPDLQLIATTPVRGRPMDILDDHYYNNPQWFLANAGRYDRYPATGAKVYVGEYAVTQNCGLGNLRAAVAEAAFMMGFERNADRVILSSYAPLFVNVRDRKWNPDAICFDTTRAYGTPSYHVQKLFAVHRPDTVLQSELSAPRPQAVVQPGGVGLATWRTQAEFKDVRVTRGAEELPLPAFEQWRVVRGDWSIRDGAYRQQGRGEDLRAVAGNPAWTDYAYTLKARKLGGDEGFLIMFRARDDGNWYWWNIGGWNNTQHAIERSEGGAKRIIGAAVPGRVEADRWYDIRVEMSGSRIRCYLDGRLVHDVEDLPPSPIHAVAGRVERTGELIVKVVNAGDQPQPLRLEFRGAPALSDRAEMTVLTSAKPDDENTLEAPMKVAPVSGRLTGVRSGMQHVLPAHSLTILRVRAGRGAAE